MALRSRMTFDFCSQQSLPLPFIILEQMRSFFQFTFVHEQSILMFLTLLALTSSPGLMKLKTIIKILI